jgi:dATP/dGTP diphosphohydrolase
VKDNPKHIRAMKEGKVPAERIPFSPLAAVARVMAGGAKKYGIRNFLLDEIKASTYIGAIFRHTFLEWAQGIDKDKDDGEHPLAHVIACCLLVLEAEKYGTLIDDRLYAESINGDTGAIRRVLRALPRKPQSKAGAGRAQRSAPRGRAPRRSSQGRR